MKTILAGILGVVLVIAAVEVIRTAETSQPAPSGKLISLGKQIYAKQCAACHGEQGRGDGEAAYLLYPKPRDFVAANYRLVSTWERIPTDQDLFNTITRGMPGSAMPSWGHLPEEQRWALVYYIKSLAEKPLAVKPQKKPAADGTGGEGLIHVPPEPPYDAAAKAKAIELFRDACASCHGATAKGDGVQEQVDAEGFPTRPRDLTAGIFKGNPNPVDLYRRIIAGIPGSPMPSSDWAYGDDAWHLVHYVLSLSSERQRERAEMKKFEIVAVRVKELPVHPDSGVWRLARPVNLHLMPLWWRSDRPEEVTVRAVHDGKEIAILMVWADATHDHTAMRPQDFRDAAAIQFSLAKDPPFFAMGEKGNFVNIWMWKSEVQADIEMPFHDLEIVYPNLGIDSYPNLMKSPVEQPTRHALTLESDKTFVTGWGAGNIVSNPARKTPVEDLNAQGFGTLRARPPIDQKVDAKGVYGAGSYRVMFKRSLKPTGKNAIDFKPGTTVPVAFAVWNGSAGDRDGKKSVTIWQELKIAE
ncbi:MAG TPA: ethylbenzene dehydrogenase-related protein [Candidatus Acidoferrales bacterium]|nr:ethylbenzene dehydrogenase-related protein [Candidatus Acidoferrales bacterium]